MRIFSVADRQAELKFRLNFTRRGYYLTTPPSNARCSYCGKSLEKEFDCIAPSLDNNYTGFLHTSNCLNYLKW